MHNKSSVIRSLLISSVLIILVVIYGCSSVPDTPPCINKSAVNSKLRWGIVAKGKIKNNLSIKMNGLIEEFVDDTTSSSKDLPYGYVNPDTLCIIMQDLGILIIETQSLSVPADTNYFVDYVNPDRNYYFRALWNPVLLNESNTKFHEFYLKLEKLKLNKK